MIKYVFVASLMVVLLLSNPSTFYTVDVDAQQVRLSVSVAEDPDQNNTFFGPQIVQIVIDDSSATNADTNTGSLIVQGQSMQRVHLTDGKWYSFIAEKDSFLLFLDIMTDGVRDNKISVSDTDDADNRNKVGSMTVEFEFADSFVREITEVGGNLFIEVDKDDIFPTLPEPFVGTDAINPDLDINPSSELAIDWPYIKLFDIQENNIIDVRHGNIVVSLTYNRYYDDIQMTLDRGSYPPDSDIIMIFKDFMWNINPVEEDVVRFVLDKSTGRPNKIIYQPLRNFDPANDGLNLVDILPSFPLLDFDHRQMVEVDNVENLKFSDAYDSSSDTIIEFPEESGRPVSAMTTSQSPVVTFIESIPNTSLFSTIDAAKGSRSNIFAGKEDSSISMNYFDIIASASIQISDAFVTADKDVYDSTVRATFTVTDQDLNRRSTVAERHDGIESKTYIQVGNPFPLTNNDSFDTLPRDNNGNFLPDSIQAVKFNTVSGTAETVDFDGDGADDFFANVGDIDNRNPSKTDYLALDFTTADIGGSLPTGFIINSDVNLAQIASTTTFTMTKEELLEETDPFIRAVSNLEPEVSATFEAALNDERITVTFPHYNLININLSKLNAVFAKVFVEMEASNAQTIVTQMVDFQPFDDEDVDGDIFFKIDPLLGLSGFGSFKALDFFNVDWNGDGIVGDSADTSLLNNIPLKFTVIIADSANTPLPITSTSHLVVLDIVGLGVIRAKGATVESISVDASENVIYRLGINEEDDNSSKFSGRADFKTVLQSDTVQGILQETIVIGDPLKIWMPHRFVPPNRLALSYTDLGISGVFRQVSTTFNYETRDGKVSWDRQQYRFNQVAMLTVIDEDLNRVPDAIERYSIPQVGFLLFEVDKQRVDIDCQELTPIPDECFINFIEATLTETAPNSSEFRAQITIPQRVLLVNGDTIKTVGSNIRAVYVDIRDISSNTNEFLGDARIGSTIDTSQSQQEPVTENPSVVERGSVKIELDEPAYHPYSRVYITITSKDKNADSFRSDVIFIDISRQSDNTGLQYKLVETGINTGVFTGYLNLHGPDGSDGGIGPKDGVLKINVVDTLEVSFEAATINIPIHYNEGKVLWGKNSYIIGERAELQVVDPDMNKNADIPEILKVTLLVKNAKISYDLQETEANSGVFIVEVPFVAFTDKVLEKEVGVVSGDTVTAVYGDMTVPEALKGTTDSTSILSAEASVQISNILEVVGVNRAAQTGYRLVDKEGNMVTSPNFRDSYRVESKVHNNTVQPLQFEFIVQIANENGVVEYLESVMQEMAPNDSITPSLDWKPSKRGNYTVEIFVWQNLDLPSPLSPATKNKVIIV